MNQQYNFRKLSLFILLTLFITPMAFAEIIQINWLDNSNNEDGFIIEKRLSSSASFQRVSVMPANSSQYSDSDVNIDETYCYRISAYNQAGESRSDELCIEVNGLTPSSPLPPDPNLIEPSGYMSISHQFIAKPVDIEIGEKELYSFKSDAFYNEGYSNDEIYNVNFSVNEGKVGYSNRDYFSFQQEGLELENGTANMNFNTANNLSFVLQGSGTMQTASLYIQAGVWSSESSSLIVTVGEVSEKITLPKGYRWYYLSIDIEFDGVAPVNITTDSDRDGYSSVMLAGIVLNEKIENIAKYASMVSVETGVGSTVDTTDVKFMTSQWNTGNLDSSEATIDSLTFYGKNKWYASRYDFNNLNGDNYSGYRSMNWNEENGIVMKLKSGESQINTVSLYFHAGAWSSEDAFIELNINGESELIELSSGYRWHYMKVDIEFEGELDIDLHPVGTFSGYSALGFAGLTLE